MEVKIKKLMPQAVIPTYAKRGDAGLDLVAMTKVTASKEGEVFPYIEYGTGLAIEIPEGYVGLLFPRSSISKSNLTLANSVGVIDSGYRGEIKLRFRIVDNHYTNYNLGDKIGQLIILPYPQISLVEVDELAPSERGEGGFGHTGV